MNPVKNNVFTTFFQDSKIQNLSQVAQVSNIPRFQDSKIGLKLAPDSKIPRFQDSKIGLKLAPDSKIPRFQDSKIGLKLAPDSKIPRFQDSKIGLKLAPDSKIPRFQDSKIIFRNDNKCTFSATACLKMRQKCQNRDFSEFRAKNFDFDTYFIIRFGTC